MGMRIRKKWDLPSEQSGALILMSTTFFLSGVVGCLFAALASGEGAQELGRYLADYFTLVQGGDLPRDLWHVLWGQLKYLLAALTLGLTALGTLGLPLLLGLRGFFLTFSVACFCRVFGSRGMIAAFVLFALPALLWVPALFVSGVPGFLSARRRLCRLSGEGVSTFYPGGNWWFHTGLCLGLGLAAGLLEYWVIPVLLRAVVKVVL